MSRVARVRLLKIYRGEQTGHRLDNTARYSHVAAGLLREVKGPLEYLDIHPPG